MTTQNLAELGITESILDHPKLVYTDASGKKHKPLGVSINETVFGVFPGTALERGWITYMNIGEPLIEERSSLAQPPPDTLSARVYVNRDTTAPRKFEDTVEFSISNTFSWSVQGTLQLTLGAKESASLQKMIQTQHTVRQSYKESGTDTAYTVQEQATGQAELSGELMLALTGSVSGSLTTSWTSRSTVSGDLVANSRVETRATQRRVAKNYSYEIPIAFAGHFAVNYPVKASTLTPPQDYIAEGVAVVARNIADIELVRDSKFRQRGAAESVSALAVEHTVFERELLTADEQQLHKKPKQG
ncbi:hypothetical protein ACGFOU_03950 [Streptomyces sp. NPDC048595]|uniref:hypothetical protein n=1 Tax=Streptomyces sp. NPDC048595 TaxID=3365576 RepID=UPI003719D1B1